MTAREEARVRAEAFAEAAALVMSLPIPEESDKQCPSTHEKPSRAALLQVYAVRCLMDLSNLNRSSG